MTPYPTVEPLSRRHRRLLFVLSITIFAVFVPLLVFYATGYRFDFSGDSSNIRTVGGIYLSSGAKDTAIFVDEKQVTDMRIFQNAAYIQDVDAGLHEIHTQNEALATWSKELPVYAHFVTEVKSFNLPLVPQVRLIAPLLTKDGGAVVKPSATSSLDFTSITNTLFATSSESKVDFISNPEHEYLTTLFASTSAERQLYELRQSAERRFVFPGTGTTSEEALVATTTKTIRDKELRESEGSIVAVWTGNMNNIPYYYCVTYTGPESTALAYGSHVYAEIEKEFASTTDLTDKELLGKQMCRTEIKINDQNKKVKYFDFLPESEDLVIIHLSDGIYVTEIDDRAWQNVQLLYPGKDLKMLIDSGSIFVEDGKNILEVYTKLQS